MGIRDWFDKIMGPTGNLPDAKDLNQLNAGKIINSNTTAAGTASVGASGGPWITSGGISSGALTGTVTIPSSGYTMGSITTSSYTFPSMGSFGQAQVAPKSYTIGGNGSPTIITFFDNNGQWVVKLDQNGNVTWSNGENITQAAKAFAEMLSLGVEQKAGVTQSMKLKVRDQVFEEVIRMAQERGPLSADDLTFMLESSKIIEKLRGINE